MVKVRKTIKNKNVCDMNLLIQKGEEIIDWDDSDLVKSIVEEIEIAETSAIEIGKKVKDKIRDVATTMGWESVPTTFIREFVSNEIIALGKKYKKKANKYNLIGLSPHEIKAIIENTESGENSNIAANNPEAVNFAITEVLLKKYAFQEVFSKKVSDNHLNGNIHLHDSSQPHKNYAFSKRMKFNILYPNGENKEISLLDLWNSIDVQKFKINGTQYCKEISDLGFKILDRDKYIGLEMIVYSDEEKNMIDFIVENGLFSVTEDHGCVVERDSELIIIRADEVRESDKFISY